MTIDEMFNELEDKAQDTFIVTLKYKYDFEKNYTIENHILEYDSLDDSYVWLNDWYEGQTDVEVLGYMLLGDVDTTKLLTCEDCISRQAVLDKKELVELEDGQSFYCINPKDVETLPSVTPQQTSWIPVSERLPEEYIHVLCQFTLGGMGECYLAHGVFHVVGGLVMTCNEVIAWMPLPKPYEESEDEE